MFVRDINLCLRLFQEIIMTNITPKKDSKEESEEHIVTPILEFLKKDDDKDEITLSVVIVKDKEDTPAVLIETYRNKPSVKVVKEAIDKYIDGINAEKRKEKALPISYSQNYFHLKVVEAITHLQKEMDLVNVKDEDKERIEAVNELLRNSDLTDIEKIEARETLNSKHHSKKKALENKKLLEIIFITDCSTNKNIRAVLLDIETKFKPTIEGYNQNGKFEFISSTQTKNGFTYLKELSIANFYFRVDKELKNIEDDSRKYEAVIICDNIENPFNISSVELIDKRKFETEIRKVAGANFNAKHISDLVNAFTNEATKVPEKLIYTNQSGWYTYRKIYEKIGNVFDMPPSMLDEKIYISKSMIIERDRVIRNNLIRVDVPSNMKASFFDLRLPSVMYESDSHKSDVENKARMEELKAEEEKRFIEVGHHFRTDFMNLYDPFVINMKIVDHFSSIYTTRMREVIQDESEYISIYYGAGHGRQGKTFIEVRLMFLHGNFPNEKCLITWNGTTTGIAEQGEFCNDLPFLIDDMKKEYIADPKKLVEFIKFLHAHVAGADKIRHTRSNMPNVPTRGHMIINSENKLTHDASNEGRICYVFVPVLPKKKEIGKRCIENQKDYYLLKIKFIQWMEKQSDKEEFSKYFDEFSNAFGGTDASKPKMYALRYFWFEKFCQFMNAHGFMTTEDAATTLNEFKKQVIEIGKESAMDMITSEPAEILIQLVKVAIVTGDYTVLDNENSTKNNRPVVGRITKHGKLEIYPEKALELVKQRSYNQYGSSFTASQSELTKAFRQKGWISGTTVNSESVRTWQI